LTNLHSPESLSALRDWAAERPEIRGLVVFGSQVKGTARPSSDIDIAVIFRPEHRTKDETMFDWIDGKRTRIAEIARLLSVEPCQVQFEDLTKCHVRRYAKDTSLSIYDPEGEVARLLAE
jgi:predicted nucleotidyltransferase